MTEKRGDHKWEFRIQGSLELQERNEVQAEETKATSALLIYASDIQYESYPRTMVLGMSQILVQRS